MVMLCLAMRILPVIILGCVVGCYWPALSAQAQWRRRKRGALLSMLAVPWNKVGRSMHDVKPAPTATPIGHSHAKYDVGEPEEKRVDMLEAEGCRQ